MAEISTKPYLIRAIYEWCCDNGYTPHLVVKAGGRARLPMAYVRNGEIVLNVSPTATNGLQMGNDVIEFQARFNGVPEYVVVPVDNVLAIFARETGFVVPFNIGPAGRGWRSGGCRRATCTPRPGRSGNLPGRPGRRGRIRTCRRGRCGGFSGGACSPPWSEGCAQAGRQGHFRRFASCR